MKEKTKENKMSWSKHLSFLSLSVIVLLIGVLSIRTININMLDSIVTLDVNPSLEFQINKNEKIIKVDALNNDGIKILNDMDLKGTNLNVAMNAVIGSMLRNGYISELQNSILITVNNNNKEKSKQLEKKLTDEINSILSMAKIEGAIISQTENKDNNTTHLANQYNISTGKVNLINEIVSKNDKLKFEDLAKLSINELNIISESKKIESEKYTTSGNASKKAYITKEKALEKALSHVKIEEKNIYGLEIEFDSENGILVYEIEFDTKENEHNIEVNAKTGEIVKSEKEFNDEYNGELDKKPTTETKPNNNSSSSNNSQSSKYISKSEAKNVALKKAGLKASDIRDYEINLDEDDGTTIYEIEFKSGKYEYSIDINAKTGKIIEYDKEIDD